jgi:SAM-dependent methyltransferase
MAMIHERDGGTDLKEQGKPKPFMGSMPNAVMKRLVHDLDSANRPWRDVLADESLGLPERKIRWFTNPRKGMFYRSVAPGRGGAFLDVGAASGIVSACLSEVYERGYALEQQQVFVDFMRHRFRMDSIQNVEVLHGSALAIPLPDGSIDLGAVNGVLEWVAHGDRESNPRDVQLRFLREVRRCLRPDGKIVIAIENAWDYRQIKGVTAHGTARYVGFLPKWLGNAVNQLVKKRPYLEYVYSYFGYKRLLRDAGYNNVQIFVVMPNYHTPEDIYQFDKSGLDALYLKYHSRSRIRTAVKKLSGMLGVPYLWAYVEAAFYVVADK